jgi:glycerophosphoryl diester phosphodiesterase
MSSSAPSVQVIGHRGYGFEDGEYENTMPSLMRGLCQCSGGIELDVMLSKDGHLVVHHDDTLERCTNGTGAFADYTLDELRKLQVGGSHAMPTLMEVLVCARDQNAKLGAASAVCVEMKGKNVEKETARCIVESGIRLDMVKATSFDHDRVDRFVVELAKLSEGKVTVGYIGKQFDEALVARALERGVHELHLDVRVATRDTVERVQRAGLAISLWFPGSMTDREETQRAWATKVLDELRPNSVCANFPSLFFQ